MEYIHLKRSFAASILLHLGIILILTVHLSRNQEQSSVGYEVQLIDAPTNSVEQRVVRSTDGVDVEAPAEAAFLSEKTRTVKKQTVARNPRTLVAPQVKLSDLGVKLSDGKGPTPPVDVRRGWERPSEQFGATYQEHVEGLDAGEQTALNTREFVFFGYYERIRQRLDIAWPRFLRSELEGLYRQGRNLASSRDHITRTLVSLDRRGRVVRVQIVEESGTRDLDSAAVRAFNAAGPFPNPPKELFPPGESEIQIRWDFVLKT